jgi:hypothetical protein
MEHNIAFGPLKEDEKRGQPQKPHHHRPSVSPDRDKSAGDKKGEAVSKSVRSEESSGLTMGKKKVVFNERKQGGETGAA